jgi:hypothetical protein
MSRQAVLLSVLAVLAPLAAPPLAAPAAGEVARPFNVRLDRPARAEVLRRLLEGTRRRLQGANCEKVLDAFRDEQGSPLRQKLDVLDQNAAGYLGMLFFRDGSELSSCKRSGVFAVTTPGGRVVYLCPLELERVARRDPRTAEAILIHEVLHTLGLGENPPTSGEITAKVLKHCS